MGTFPLLEEWKMKKETNGGWRPVSGAILVGALALAVSAYAAPRTTDSAASRGKDTVPVRSEAANLVTGSTQHLQSVVDSAIAGHGSGPVIRVIPGTAKNPVPGYPAGTVIVGGDGIDTGGELQAFTGGFRVWLEHRVGGWAGTAVDPGTVQTKIDGDGSLNMSGRFDSDTSDPGLDPTDDGNADDITYPSVACASNPTCRTTFGENWARCEVPSALCDTSYVDKNGEHPQSYCFDFGPGPCSQGACNITSDNHVCFGLTAGARPDPGFETYFATTVMDVPAGAKGRYIFLLHPGETFLFDSAAPPVEIPSQHELGFSINILTGSCCNQLGTPNVNCIEGLTQAECNAVTGPIFWQPNQVCPAVCVECTQQGADPLCNDNDSCTEESCNAQVGLCNRNLVAGWDPATECCEGSGLNPVITTIDDGDDCTRDSCDGGPTPPDPPPGSENGTAQHNAAAAAGDPCSDGNPCTYADRCNGQNSEADGGCQGVDVNTAPCAGLSDCPVGAQSCDTVAGLCVCTLTPNLGFTLITAGDKTCVGGFTPGAPCATNADCPGGGACDNYAAGANCYDEGEKITARVHIGSAASPINGGQVLIEYNPACLDLQNASCFGAYTTTLAYVPNESAGTVFLACGVDAFAGLDGPLGNTDLAVLSFLKVGDCSECTLCFDSNNPQNTYLVDDDGYRVDVDAKCKSLKGDGELVLETPGDQEVNSNCNTPTGVANWDAPSASFSCGTASLSCRGAHESGLAYDNSVVMGGGTFLQGLSSFCCCATANDACDATAGCCSPSAAACGPSYDGCWTVEVTDETSFDIDVQLEPPINHTDVGGALNRCIEFCLYNDCSTAPVCFEQNVTFGGLYNYTGKAVDKIKIPKGKWHCITAQDQLHTLRSCDNPDCINGQLIASFKGDPRLGGNWLVGGNVDGYKKGFDPGASEDVVDILDFGKFVSQYGVCYSDNDVFCDALPYEEGDTNADINGDGCVTISDYAFITRNFMKDSKECCNCGSAAGDADWGIAEISVDDLRAMGEGDLAVADVNGDGMLNAADMEAFNNGARPIKSGNGRGGKGLRSGR
jgi:hypothetical protein